MLAPAAAKLYQPLCVCHLFDLGFFYRSQGMIWLKLAERLSFFSVPPQLVLLLKEKFLGQVLGGCYVSSIEGLKPVKLHIRNTGSSVPRLTTQAKLMRFIKLHYHPLLSSLPCYAVSDNRRWGQSFESPFVVVGPLQITSYYFPHVCDSFVSEAVLLLGTCSILMF